MAYILSVGDKSGQNLDLETDDSAPLKEMYLNVSGYRTWSDPSGNPAIQPPWGMLHALNLSTGEYEWQIPLGNNLKLQEAGASDTGMEGKAGPIVTAGGLVFLAGAEDKKFRAFEKPTGKLLWEITLPAMANATPTTYWVDDKQYVSIAVGGTPDSPSGSITAFALP